MEQQIIDVMMECILRLRMGDASFPDNESCAAWVREQLIEGARVKTVPVGSSHAVIDEYL